MKVSRRKFVGTAGYIATAASLCALPFSAFAASVSSAKDETHRTLLNLESNCALPESFIGIQAALGDSHHSVLESEFTSALLASSTLSSRSSGRGRLIVPAAGTVRPATFIAVTKLLHAGATVLWESGAAFLEPREFAAQQHLTREYFAISMDEPVHVWSRAHSREKSPAQNNDEKFLHGRALRAIGHHQVPYITYRWPRESSVRDFSRVIPISASEGQAIAHWKETPVAWNRPVGSGTLIFVGSPLGLALRTGDPEATALFRSIMT